MAQLLYGCPRRPVDPSHSCSCHEADPIRARFKWDHAASPVEEVANTGDFGLQSRGSDTPGDRYTIRHQRSYRVQRSPINPRSGTRGRSKAKPQDLSVRVAYGNPYCNQRSRRCGRISDNARRVPSFWRSGGRRKPPRQGVRVLW